MIEKIRLNHIVGISLFLLGSVMLLSIPFTPKFILNWYHTSDYQFPKGCIECNIENALAHSYLILMLFGGLFFLVKGMWIILE